MREIIVVLGPTASGKSALGVQLAKRFRGVVVSADSRQVYRGLDRCFGTITKREQRGVSHCLLRFVPLNRQYTAGEYAQNFQRVLKRIPTKQPIFLVGGSPFYIEAALHPERLASVPPNPKLRRQLEKLIIPQLVSRLSRLDSRRLPHIDPHNRRRLIRALEITLSHRSLRPPFPHSPIPLRVLKIGITLPRKELYKKIDQRVNQRLLLGMLQEVQRVHRRGISWSRLESFGLEPRYLSRILRQQISYDEGIRQLKTSIHGFVRRQLTWWRRDRTIRWVRTPAQAVTLVRKFLSY